MLNRLKAAVVLVVAGLVIGLGPAGFAQEMTAKELYDLGLKQYQAGELEQAKQMFRRVDPMQLPRAERIKLYETLQSIDQQLEAAPAASAEPTAATEPAAAAEPAEAAPAEGAEEAAVAAAAEPEAPREPTAEELLALGDAAAADDPAAAAAIYQQVIATEDVSDATAATAKARLAQVQRRMKPDVATATMLLDTASADLKAGNIDAASAKYQAVKNSGVKLGWFDKQRLDRGMAYVAEQQALAAAEAEAAAKAAAEAEAARAAEAEATAAAPAGAAVVVAPVAVQQETAATPAPNQEDLLAQMMVVYAGEKAAEGDKAMSEGQLALAVELYEESLKLNPDDQAVQEKLAAARAARNAELMPQQPVEGIIERNSLQVQEALAQFDAAMNESRKQLDAANYPAATDAVNAAKVVLDGKRGLLAGDVYAARRAKADDLTNKIQLAEKQANKAQVERVEQIRKADQENIREEAREAREAEIEQLLRRAMDLQKDQRYGEALALVNQALFIDPADIRAQFLKLMLEDARILTESARLDRDLDLRVADVRLENKAAMMPQTELIVYPDEWPQLTTQRLASMDTTGGDSEINRRIALQLREPVPVNFEQNRLSSVIEYLRNTTGVNFFVNWPALDAAGVADDTPISLQLNQVPADRALSLVLQQAGAGSAFDPIGYSIIDGIVMISTERDLNRSTDIRVYDIRDLLVQVPNFTDVPSFDLNDALSNTNSGGSNGSGGGSSGGNIFGDNNDSENTEDSLSRQEMIEEIQSLLRDTVGKPEDWAALGGDVSSLRELNGNLIVKTTPENHRRIVQVLAQLRETRAIQISVEARFLLVDDEFLEEIGVDLDMRLRDLGGHWGPISMAQDSISLAQGLTGAGAANLSIVTPELSDDEGVLLRGDFLRGEGFTPSGRAMDFNASFMDDLEVNLLVRATQTNRKSISLTAPRVTFFNGQRAYVVVARQIAFVSDLEPVPDAAGFDVTLSVTQSGVVLDVEGTISADRRYVTLTLRPSLATVIEPIRTISIVGTTNDGGDDDNAGTDTTFFGVVEAPELEITSIRATVSVPDRGTLLVGGQRVVGEVDVEAGVPVLSKIPVINRLFTNTSTQKDERTLLILVKPTIIIQSEQEEELFPGLLSDPGTFNVGLGN